MLKNPFLIELKQRYLDAFSKCNRGSSFQKKEWDFITKAGQVEINVCRGEVFEKVCVSSILSRVTIPGRDFQSTIQWLGLQAFSSNPLVPMFMAAFEHVEEENEERFPCYFDVYPAVALDEDKQYLSAAIGGVCKKYNRTYPDLPEGYLRMFQLKEAGTGVGYGVGMALKPIETDFEFYKEIANSAHQSYFDLVDKRKDEQFSKEQSQTLDKFRAEWTRFVFMDNRFFAGGVKLGVPVEAFMLHMLPPSVKF